MKRNPLHYIVVILLVGDLLLAGCALAHHSAFYITQPHNGDVFAASQQVTVRVEVIDLTAYDHSGWTSYEYTISDAGQVIAHVSEESIRQRNVWVNENNPWPGAHYLMVTARAARPDPDYADVPNNTYRIFSDWYTSNEVCFWVGRMLRRTFARSERSPSRS